MDIATTLRWTAERFPDRVAVGGPQALSYAEWDAHTEWLAARLLGLGPRPGDRIVLMLQGGEPLASLHLAAQKAGITSVPLSTRFDAREIGYCIADCAPVLVLTDESAAVRATDAVSSCATPPQVMAAADLLGAGPTATSLPPAPRETDLSVMLYTSGTTGRPKGVPRTHRAEHTAALAHLIQTGQPPGAVSLGVMPMFHTMGMRSLLASIVSAGTWVPQATFDADETLELITSERIDTLYLVPTMFWALMQTGRLHEAESIKRLAYAGAAMTPALAEQLTEAIHPERFVNHFGSTEIYTFTIGPNGTSKPGCAGRAGVFSRVRLVDPDPAARPDQLVGPGEQGQVAVSMESPEAFSGYWNRPDADETSIRDGWYFTGDLATTDADGDLWVSGRVDDMINSGGENLYPEEIERSLSRCPGLDTVVVVGTPHDKWGSAVTAFFVPRDGADPQAALVDVKRWVSEQSGLPSLKRPKRFIAVEAIPVSAVGKILRRHLSEGEYDVLADSEEPR